MPSVHFTVKRFPLPWSGHPVCVPSTKAVKASLYLFLPNEPIFGLCIFFVDGHFFISVNTYSLPSHWKERVLPLMVPYAEPLLM